MEAWGWVLFNLFVVAMLVVDLGIFHRKAHEISIREALAWTGVWIVLALLFNGLIFYWRGTQTGLEFLTGYLIEKSLSVDNLFVFLLIFHYFKVPAHLQHRVLFWGILGALVIRALFIIVGVKLIEQFTWLIYVFAAFLIYSGWKLFFEKDIQVEPEKNPVLRLFRRFVPVTHQYEGSRFFVQQAGRILATPLFVVLLVIETTDIIFAVDSIPAILGITTDAFIVYTSNVFAILGLRSLYFALAGLMRLFHYLHYGLAFVLIFVGVKMVLHQSDVYHIPIGVTLAVVGSVLVLSTIASLLLPLPKEVEEAERAFEQAGIHPLFADGPLTPAPLPRGERGWGEGSDGYQPPKEAPMGQMIDIAGEQNFRGYLALPEGGSGPGIVMLPEIFGVNPVMRQAADLYAQEGYVVLVPDLFFRLEPGLDLGYDPASFQIALGYYQRFDVGQGVKDIGTALAALRARPECTGKVAAIGFCLGGLMAYLTAARQPVDAAVGFYGVNIEQHLGEAGNIRCPMILHFGLQDDLVSAEALDQIKRAFSIRPEVSILTYADAGHGFYLPGRDSYRRPAAWLAHSPTIALLRQVLGPRYDLNALWNRHCECELAIRNAAETMKTMVANPYVNHIPTMTGGVGQDELYRFYANHFIPKLPKDTRLIPISRTIGADRIVDELLFCFTHDTEIDFMLPGVAPTGKYVEVPTVAIVCFRGNKLYHEHIYWDQASVLVQIGLLDPNELPVVGIETAKKVLDEKRPSNTLMKRQRSEVRSQKSEVRSQKSAES